MGPQDNQTPLIDEEPPTVGQVAVPLAQAIPSPPTSTVLAEQPKRRRWPLIVGMSVFSIILVVSASIAVFYFFYRTPDSAYDALLKDLNSMRQDAEIIPAPQRNLSDSLVDDEAAKVAASQDYIGSLERVKKSVVLAKDDTVRRAYDNDKSIVEEYGQSSLDMIKSAGILREVSATCQDEFDKIAEVKTLVEFDRRFDECVALLAKYPNVPLESFDESYYRRYVSAIDGAIDAMRLAFKAVEANDRVALDAANDQISLKSAVYRLATSGSPKLTNTANPTDAIKRTITAAKERRSVFFR